MEACAERDEARALLRECRDVFDVLMGDSDLPDDDSREMVCMQRIAKALGEE